MSGAVKDATKAIKLNGEETIEAINKIEDIINYAFNFDSRLLEPIGEITKPKKVSIWSANKFFFKGFLNSKKSTFYSENINFY